jgi:hypothetical protein
MVSLPDLLLAEIDAEVKASVDESESDTSLVSADRALVVAGLAETPATVASRLALAF